MVLDGLITQTQRQSFHEKLISYKGFHQALTASVETREGQTGVRLSSIPMAHFSASSSLSSSRDRDGSQDHQVDGPTVWR